MGLALKTGKLVVQDGRRMSVISLAFALKGVCQLAVTLFSAELCIEALHVLVVANGGERSHRRLTGSSSALQFRQAKQKSYAFTT